jgi:hypothetical protein
MVRTGTKANSTRGTTMAATTTNKHGEKVTVIGTVTDGRGGRQNVTVTEFTSCGRPCYSLQTGSGGHPDARRFDTQVKRAKRILGHESNLAEWLL